jgi:saccharopine dehydrogenase-like NADP-dependent oxidoreductase
MLARGEIDKPGVFAPEAILDPDEFLPRLAKRGVSIRYQEAST